MVRIELFLEEAVELFSEKFVEALIKNISVLSHQNYLPAIEVIGECLEREGKIKVQLFQATK